MEHSDNQLSDIANLISDNKLDDAIDKLLGFVKSDSKGEIVLIKSRLSNINQQSRRGILSQYDYNRFRAEICSDLLDITKEFNKSPNQVYQNDLPSQDDYNRFRAKILNDLLDIAKESNKAPNQVYPDDLPKKKIKDYYLFIIGVGIVLFLVALLRIAIDGFENNQELQAKDKNKFDLTVYLEIVDDIGHTFDSIRWQLRLGKYQYTQEISGRKNVLVFHNIPIKYYNEPVKLRSSNDLYKILEKSHPFIYELMLRMISRIITC